MVKMIKAYRIVFLSGLQENRREIILIRAVGEMLRFQAKCRTMPIRDASFSGVFPIQKIAAVKLDTRFVRVNRHYPSRFGINDLCSHF